MRASNAALCVLLILTGCQLEGSRKYTSKFNPIVCDDGCVSKSRITPLSGQKEFHSHQRPSYYPDSSALQSRLSWSSVPRADKMHNETFVHRQKRTPLKSNQPIVFLHVGPQKTSTSGIQSFLADNEDGLKLHDNITLPAPFPIRIGNSTKMLRFINSRHLIFCFSSKETRPKQWRQYLSLSPPLFHCEEVLSAFLDFVRTTRASSKNILMSAECLSFLNAAQIQHFVKTCFVGWEIRVIVVYRRFDEWLPSFHFQDTRSDRAHLRSTLVEYLDSPESLHAAEFAYSHAVAQRYRSIDPNLTMLNFHHIDSNRSLIEEFLCRGLQGLAPHTCRIAETFVAPKENSGYSLDAGFVLAVALKKNLLSRNDRVINGTISLQYEKLLFESIEQKLQESTNLPFFCATEPVQQYIRNRTMEWFPFDLDFLAAKQSTGYNKNRPPFCSLDASALCERADWQLFLRGL